MRDRRSARAGLADAVSALYARVSHAVGAVMVAMELVDERYEDYQALG